MNHRLNESSGRRLYPFAILVASAWLVAGCQSPLDQGARQQNMLRDAVAVAIDRELTGMPPAELKLKTTQQPSDVEAALEERREDLDSLGPYPPAGGGAVMHPSELGTDLTGNEQGTVAISLADAIGSTVENNLDVQFARLQPSISEADIVAAEANFDALFFTSADYSRTDAPRAVPVLGGTTLGTSSSQNNVYRFETGIRQTTRSGATISASTDMTITNNKTSGFDQQPDPSNLAAVRLNLTQPLLRGFGTEANTTTIRLARNAERRSIQDLRGELLASVANVEIAYWNLNLAWANLSINRWLVDVGVEVRDVLERRRQFDTKPAQYSDAVARVEQRKADVIRSRRSVRAASDQLKSLINDSAMTVGSEIVLSPIDQMVDAPIEYSLREAIMTAMASRPEIQQAILGIDDASIRESLADNLRLPRLDLAAEVNWQGLSGSTSNAYHEVNESDFVNYVVGLLLEIPIGNRAAEAGFRQARLQRSAAVIAYRRAVQLVVLDVKNALRDVITNFELIQATRSFRVAQAENLRALLAEEETLASLTPEFLNLKFNQQDTLANARFQEVQAMANLDQAVARLYQAMGIGLKMNQIDVMIEEPDDGIDAVDAQGS